MNKSILKNCVHCGGEAVFCESHHHPAYVHAICKKCGMRTADVYAKIDYCANDKAAELWNARVEKTTEAAITLQLKTYEELLDSMGQTNTAICNKMIELSNERDDYKKRAEALEKAVRLSGYACRSCVHEPPCGGCVDSCCWRFDEARFTKQDGNQE